MKIYTIDYIPDEKIMPLGTVSGTVVNSTNVGRDIMAGFKTLVGGEIETYTKMLTEARQTAISRMVSEAENMGADAILNVRFGSSSIMQNAAEIIAYGTAVRILPAD